MARDCPFWAINGVERETQKCKAPWKEEAPWNSPEISAILVPFWAINGLRERERNFIMYNTLDTLDPWLDVGGRGDTGAITRTLLGSHPHRLAYDWSGQLK